MKPENHQRDFKKRRPKSRPQPLARSLDELFRGAPGAKRARALAALKRDWASVAGLDLARLSELEGIQPARGRTKGALILRAAPGGALVLQHEAPRLLERVNGFLGADVVGRVKIAPGLPRQAARQPFTPPPLLDENHPRSQDIAKRAKDVGSPRLAEALTRLGRAVGSR